VVPNVKVTPGFVLAAVLAMSLAFAVWTVPPRVLFGGEPIANLDYALHFARAAAAEDFWERDGRTWGYDPYFLAGYPMGTVFDVNNKGVELFVAVVHHLGPSTPTAFNALVFLVVLLPAAAVWLTARNFGLTHRQRVVAAGLALALWVFDREVSKTWRIGVFASGMAMYGLPLSLSYLYRFLRERSTWSCSAFLVSAVLLSVFHPLSFLFFYAPLAAYLLLSYRPRDSALWTILGALAALVIVVNLSWIVPVLQQWGYKTRSGYHWIGDLKALGGDVLGLNESGLRLAIYLLGCGGLWFWWREADRDRLHLVLAPVLALSFFGYVSGELHAFQEAETYRNNLVAAFLLLLPAAVFLDYAVVSFRLLPFVRRAVLASCVALLSLHLVGPSITGTIAYMTSGGNTGYPLGPLVGDDKAVIDWLKGRKISGHRVLVEHWPLGAMIPSYTGLEVIGGPYPYVWLRHNFANFWAMPARGGYVVRLFGRPIIGLDAVWLRRNLEAYNVGWVVAFTDESKGLFDRSEWLERITEIGRYRIYQNTDPTTAFLKGTGQLRVEHGRLVIHNASEGEIVIGYHWEPFLRADPPQPLGPQSVGDDPIPFIRVPSNIHRDFVITDQAA